MQPPLVSVHMITYNHAPYIRKAIESVLAQKTNFSFELVIGEDCSTDGTREIVFEYKDKYPNIIRVITSEHNVGAKANSRRTDQASRGKYIAFCEGDDFWHYTGKLQRQIDYLEDHPECGLVCSDYDVYRTATGEKVANYVRHRGWSLPASKNIEYFISGRGEGYDQVGVSILTCTVVLRRDLLERLKKADPYLHESSDLKMGDTQLWAEIYITSVVSFIPESFATHCILAESASNSRDNSKRLHFNINGTEMMMYLCDKYHVSPMVRRIHEMNRLNYMLSLAFYERDGAMAEMVKNEKGIVGAKEFMLYWGAKCSIANLILRALSQILNFRKVSRDVWA